MQFFSRYSYIWKFPDELEHAYARFVMPSNLNSLRLVAFITFFGMSLFLVIDLFRDVNYPVVLATRSGALVVSAILMALSFRSSLSVVSIYLSIIALALANFGSALITATYGGMPPYYITNLLFLIFVLVITASGLNFRHALFLNLTCLLVFIVFSQYVKREPFYFSQYPHLFSIFVYIHIVGVALESRRRRNFLQFRDLVQQKQLVEDLNQQKNKIISILSHDVAAPLNSLTGLLNLQKKSQLKPEEVEVMLTKVTDRLDSASTLLQGLARWSRSQMDGFVPEQKAIELGATLREIVQLFQAQAREKSLIINLDEKITQRVVGDQEMINLVFRNLFVNAIKFSGLYATISIEQFEATENRVGVRVANEGNGVLPEVKEKLFTYQVNSTPGTSGEKGTGLGLAMSAYFVKLNNGRLYLDDTREGWVAFCVELPVATM